MSLMVRDWEGGKGEKDKRSWRQEGRIIVPCPPRNWRLLGGLSTGVALSVALPTPSMAAPSSSPSGCGHEGTDSPEDACVDGRGGREDSRHGPKASCFCPQHARWLELVSFWGSHVPLQRRSE